MEMKESLERPHVAFSWVMESRGMQATTEVS
jgi:hypothetical protein